MWFVVILLVTMLLTLVIVNYLASQGVQALPAAALSQPPTADPVRTTYNIVSSCLVTIFSCTWVAIHPNIPHPGIGYKKKFLRRVRLMILALIAPECVLTWALRQWLAARRLEKKYKK